MSLAILQPLASCFAPNLFSHSKRSPALYNDEDGLVVCMVPCSIVNCCSTASPVVQRVSSSHAQHHFVVGLIGLEHCVCPSSSAEVPCQPRVLVLSMCVIAQALCEWLERIAGTTGRLCWATILQHTVRLATDTATTRATVYIDEAEISLPPGLRVSTLVPRPPPTVRAHRLTVLA